MYNFSPWLSTKRAKRFTPTYSQFLGVGTKISGQSIVFFLHGGSKKRLPIVPKPQVGEEGSPLSLTNDPFFFFLFLADFTSP